MLKKPIANEGFGFDDDIEPSFDKEFATFKENLKSIEGDKVTIEHFKSQAKSESESLFLYHPATLMVARKKGGKATKPVLCIFSPFLLHALPWHFKHYCFVSSLVFILNLGRGWCDHGAPDRPFECPLSIPRRCRREDFFRRPILRSAFAPNIKVTLSFKYHGLILP